MGWWALFQHSDSCIHLATRRRLTVLTCFLSSFRVGRPRRCFRDIGVGFLFPTFFRLGSVIDTVVPFVSVVPGSILSVGSLGLGRWRNLRHVFRCRMRNKAPEVLPRGSEPGWFAYTSENSFCTDECVVLDV